MKWKIRENRKEIKSPLPWGLNIIWMLGRKASRWDAMGGQRCRKYLSSCFPPSSPLCFLNLLGPLLFWAICVCRSHGAIWSWWWRTKLPVPFNQKTLHSWTALQGYLLLFSSLVGTICCTEGMKATIIMGDSCWLGSLSAESIDSPY